MKVNDVEVENHGSLWKFRLNTSAAQEWWSDNVDSPDHMIGPATMDIEVYFVEHRFGPPIVEGLRAAGLEVVGE